MQNEQQHNRVFVYQENCFTWACLYAFEILVMNIIKASHKCVSSGQGFNQSFFLKNGQPISQSYI